MCSANAQERSPEGAIEWGRRGKKERGRREADRGRESKIEVERELQDGEGREGQERKTERRGGRQQSSCTLS